MTQPATAKDVALHLADLFNRDGRLTQDSAVQEIIDSFGEELLYPTGLSREGKEFGQMCSGTSANLRRTLNGTAIPDIGTGSGRVTHREG